MPEFVNTAIALFIAWLFALAAWHKLRHPLFYRELLRHWFAHRAAPLLSWPLALLELALVPLLLFPATRSGALLCAALLLLAYGGAMAWQLLRGRADLKCGCAGPATNTTISRALVWRNLVCAQVAALGAGAIVVTPQPLLNSGLAVLCAAFGCLLYLCCEQLISNAQYFAPEKK